MFNPEIPDPICFRLNAFDVFTLYVWDGHEDLDATWKTVKDNVARVRAVYSRGSSPVHKAEVDLPGYLAAIQTLMPMIKRVVLSERTKVPNYPSFGDPVQYFNCNILPLYCSWKDDGLVEPSVSGFDAWSDRRGGSSEEAWDKYNKRRERLIRSYAGLIIPKRVIGRKEAVVQITRSIQTAFDDHYWMDTVFRTFVLPLLRYDHIYWFWGSCSYELAPHDEGFLGMLAYHAVLAFFFQKDEVAEKILTLMRFVRSAPGCPFSLKATTWRVYVLRG